MPCGLLVILLGCMGERAMGATLTSSDFTLAISHTDLSGNTSTLNENQLKTFFTAARCSCTANVSLTLALTSAGATNLGSSSIDAQASIGSDCDNSSATGCVAIGSALTLSSTSTSTKETLSTGDLFKSTSCDAGEVSTRLWAIVRVDGSRLSSQPSLVIELGGSGPTTPTAVKATTADSGLSVSWTDDADSSTVKGHQVLCSPGLASPLTAAFETCTGIAATSGDGPFANLGDQFICSELVTVGTNSVRLHYLENGKTYQVAVVAIGNDDIPSAPSAIATGTPNPTYGLDDLYKQDGGTAQAGCAVVPRQRDDVEGAVWILAIASLGVTRLLVRRRRRRRNGVGATALGVTLLVFAASPHALASGADSLEQPRDENLFSVDSPPTVARSSPRSWNFELRFGPYRPNVDSEFQQRGSDARPYQQLFSSSKHLLTQIEVDRQLSHYGGTWAVGVSAGYTRASAASLAADLITRTGDETALTVLPMSIALVYRADLLRRYQQIPIIPYAKVGLDYAYWSISDTAKTDSTGGGTFGWHAAAGLSLDLSSLDPEAARVMDSESGVNQTALFFEVSRYALDGFGSGSVLHLGDTTWSTGLMLEF